MNRLTNKQYVIDITMKKVQTQHPLPSAKVRCQVHYGNDFLRMGLQPIFKGKVAQFYDQRIRVPFSAQLNLVFKVLKPNKKDSLLGHYQLQVEKMLNQKTYQNTFKQKLEQSQTWVTFQCKIIDKQLLCDSQPQQMQQQDMVHFSSRDNATQIKRKDRTRIRDTTSMHPSPSVGVSFRKKSKLQHMPMSAEQFSQVVRSAEDLLKKQTMFHNRKELLANFWRDSSGNLRSQRINSIVSHLRATRRNRSHSDLIIYAIVSVVSFFIGMHI